MKNLSRFIPIDGEKTTTEANEGMSLNGGTTGFGGNLGETEGNSGTGLGSIEKPTGNIQAELERILDGTGNGNEGILGGNEAGNGCGSVEGLSGNGGFVGYNGGTGVSGDGIKSEVIGGIGAENGNSGNGVGNVGGEYNGTGYAGGINGNGGAEGTGNVSNGNSGIYEIVGNTGNVNGTSNGDSKFKVCGTNLPAKLSFWSRLKNFLKTEIAIEIPSGKKNSGTVGSENGNSVGGVGNGNGGNTSGGTGWSGLKNFFSFGKK